MNKVSERRVMRENLMTPVLHLKDIFNRARLTEIMLFGIVGSTAMVIHYAIYYLLLSVFPVSLAFSTGYFISFLYNFTMTSYFTFRVKPSMSRFLRFAASHGTNYLLQIFLLNFFIHVVNLNAKIAPVPVYAISIPVNYMLVRLAMKRRL